nr:phosphoribosylformylglycinamidine cyclo-ligase [Ignavibacteriaceae bacterium]
MAKKYEDAGVSIKAGEETVDKIKSYAKSTFNKSVLTDIGLFGAFFQPDLTRYKEPVLVSSVDGVGTKLKIAIELNKHNTIGQDLVNHCVNDIAVCGAEPLFFLDYMAFGKLDPVIGAEIVKGFSIACKENGCALIGGETAEMPGVYQIGDYDLSGTIVGIVEKSEIIKGDKITSGDVLIGVPSTGLHTNGYSLARKVLLEKYKLKDRIPSLRKTLGEELLSVHRSYLKLIKALKSKIEVKGLSHITGGGIIGNTKRILPKSLTINIDWNSWDVPSIFRLIQ